MISIYRPRIKRNAYLNEDDICTTKTNGFLYKQVSFSSLVTRPINKSIHSKQTAAMLYFVATFSSA